MFSIPILVMAVILEFVLPILMPSTHIAMRFWGNRAATLYPDSQHRLVSAIDDIDITITTNSFGFNDLEHDFANPEKKFRILLLGDSYVEGHQVAADKITARQLERLAKEKGYALEVISMGITGWGQAQHLSTYNVLGKKFSPDLVVSFFCINDFENNGHVFEGDQDYSLEQGRLVYHRPQEQLEVPLRKQLIHHTLHQTESYFAVKQLLSLAYYKKFFSEKEKAKAFFVAGKGGKRTGKPIDPQNAAQDEVHHLLKALLIELNRSITSNNSQFLGTLVSADVREEESDDFLTTYSWVEWVHKTNGIDVINFHRQFRDLYLEKGIKPHFEFDPHWSELGHRMVAERLMDYVQANFDLKPFKINQNSH